jgi:hypothetical protein
MVVKVVSCFTNTIWLDYPMYYKLIIKTENMSLNSNLSSGLNNVKFDS